MSLERRLAIGILAIGLAAGCGGSTSGHNGGDAGSCRVECSRDVSGREDSESKGDMNQGNNSDDCCLFDGGDGGKTDSDAGNGTNRAPSLRMVYEESHPLAGEIYTERNVRRGRDTPFVAEVSDPDGDDIECQFEFSDGYTRSWDSDPAVIHAFGSAGDYSLTARIRDSLGLEGEPSTIDLYVMNNIPPVARLPPCEETDPSDGLCVYRMGVFETYCWDGSESYDEDGEIISYKVRLSPTSTRIVSSEPSVCGFYNSSGERDATFYVEDDEGLEDSKDFHTIIE